MQESQWQKKKKRKRSQSKNNRLPLQNGVAKPTPTESTSKSSLQRLQNVISRLQSNSCSVDLRNDGPAWVKLATQVVVNEECSLKEGCLAACMVTHLLQRCSPHDSQAGTGGKLQMNPQHLLPFAKAIASRISPAAELHLPYLAVLSQLMVAHPGVCISLRTQLEECVVPWLNSPHGSTGARAASGAVPLAGDVWALLPVSGPAGASDNDQAEKGHRKGGGRSAGVAAARGVQLQQLMAALQVQMDRLLAGVVQLQGAQATKTRAEALSIPPVIDHHTSHSHAPKKSKKSSAHQNPAKKSASNAGTQAASDDISDPVKLVEVLVCRCCNILVFADRLLRSVTSGCNPHGITLAPKDLLLPVIRILQVSPASLQRYATTEVSRLSQLWPSVHRAALATLATAITTLDHNLVLWHSVLQRQLVSTLLAAAAVNKAHKNGVLTSNKTVEGDAVVELQDIVRQVYKCLALLMESSRGAAPVDVKLLKAVMEDLTVLPSTLVTLQNLSRKSIANMSIKKKSKSKGYTIVAKNNTPNDTDVGTKAPLSLELSHGVVNYALELLQHIASSSTAHYTLTVDCARVLHEELPKVARYFISEWRTFPHTLAAPRLGSKGTQSASASALPELHSPVAGCGGADSAARGDVCYASVSGRTDLRCFFMGPHLMEKLIRLVSSLGMCGTGLLPPHTTHLLHLTHSARLMLHRSHQLCTTAQAGTRSLGFQLAHPKIATFAQAVEDIRAANFSEVAASATRSANRGDPDVDTEALQSDGDEDASDGEASVSSDDGEVNGDLQASGSDDNVDESINDDEAMGEFAKNIEEINRSEQMPGSEAVMNANQELVSGSGEEEIMEGITHAGMNGGNSPGEESSRLPSKRALGETAGEGVQKRLKAEVKKKTKKKVKTKNLNSEIELKKGKKTKTLVKKAKKNLSENIDTDNAADLTECSREVDESPRRQGPTEECEDELSVDQMLAELAD